MKTHVFELNFQVQYAGPAIDISYPVLYPPPPSAPAPEETMNILIQRVPTRGFKKDKEAKTGANRFEDEGNLKQKYRNTKIQNIQLKTKPKGSRTKARESSTRGLPATGSVPG